MSTVLAVHSHFVSFCSDALKESLSGIVFLFFLISHSFFFFVLIFPHPCFPFHFSHLNFVPKKVFVFCASPGERESES